MSEKRLYVLRCDAPGCDEYVSTWNVYALHSLARDAGWKVGNRGNGDQRDLCAEHK